MLLDQFVDVKWNSKIKTHYVSRGYQFTKMGDVFRVNVKDLTKGSHATVRVMCDYCGSQYYIQYNVYVNRLSDTVCKDCCGSCKKFKIVESLRTRYGVDNPMDAPGASERQQQTIKDRFGVDNVFASDVIKEKIARTNIEKYGAKNPNQSEIIIAKRKATNRKRFGADSHMQIEKYRKMFSGENNPRWKTEKSNYSREQDRSLQEYHDWRKAVFGRDHFLCCCCGSRGDWKYGVQAHHIVNWSENISLRYDIKNGITLCKRCHDMFHHIYGKKHNTQEQIDEFLNHGKKVC